MTRRGCAVLERFEKHITPEPNTGCHLWTGAVNSKGYGFFRAHKFMKAHRYALSVATGVLGEQAMHSCANTSGVNPRHLSWGTNAENAAEKARRRAKA